MRVERLREPFQLPPAIALTYSRPNSSTKIDASVHFSRRSSRHLCRYRLMHAWLEPRRSATVPRALTCVPDARPRSAHLTEDGHTHDTQPHVSAYARRGVAMPLGGAQLRSRHDTPRRAPVPAPAPLSPRLRRFRAQKTRAFADFSMSESMRHASRVARLARTAPQLAPASPVFLVALGLSEDRDLFFHDCSSRA